MQKLRKHGKKIILTQIVIIAALVLAVQSVDPLANMINQTANNYATPQYTVSLTK